MTGLILFSCVGMIVVGFCAFISGYGLGYRQCKIDSQNDLGIVDNPCGIGNKKDD